MDLVICGIIDIILIIGSLLFIILGFKKGAIKKIISLAGILVILIFSLVYCGQFAQFLIHHNVIYPDIYGKINSNIISNLADKNLAADAGVSDVLSQGLNVPGFLAKLIGNGVTKQYPEVANITGMADAIAGYLATIIMNILAFFILAIGIFLIILILKLIANALRKSRLIRFIDGLLGAVLYLTIFAAIVSVLFLILSYCMDKTWFEGAQRWLEVDMQLTTDKFRISKALYEGNILKRILDLFF